MQAISAPWRMDYIGGEKPDGCIFCHGSGKCREDVLTEGDLAYVLMNRYPYTTGHLMVIPRRHVSALEDLTEAEQVELMALTGRCVRVLKTALRPEGFNIGMNLGKAAGAGVEDHLHLHIVPRWNGDTNFVSVVGEVRVIPEAVSETREKLRPLFDKSRREEA